MTHMQVEMLSHTCTALQPFYVGLGQPPKKCHSVGICRLSSNRTERYVDLIVHSSGTLPYLAYKDAFLLFSVTS